MSEAKFTDGPWVVKDGVVVCTNRSDSYTRVAYAYSGHAIPYTEEVLNNAHLIAAAPEMYEMLSKIHDYLEVSGPTGFNLSLDINDLLKKARGEK